MSAPAPAVVLGRDLQVAYRKLAELERMVAALRVDVEAQRRRVIALEHAALGAGQQ